MFDDSFKTPVNQSYIKCSNISKPNAFNSFLVERDEPLEEEG